MTDSRSGAVGATAHNPTVATTSNDDVHDGHTISVGVPSMVDGKPYVPPTELCWLEFNQGTSQWEVWTSRDSRKRMLYSSGRDHVRALDDLAIYEEQERELRQANQP